MCTVTFIPVKESVFLTSNRDEKHWRKDAIHPEVYSFNSGKILFPKDGDAGGTWIAVHENGNAIVFLNGGFEAHNSEPPYRKSRGLILIDLIEGSTPYNSFLAIKLNGIEPFTAVIWDDGHLFECRWDGREKFTKELDQKKPHIWSSVTLYDAEVIARREKWFQSFLNKNALPELKDILHFHQFSGEGDAHNDIRMNRDGVVFTVSVTSVEILGHSAQMHYLDLKNDKEARQDFVFEKNLLSGS
jgi:Transport and Golgi organisation 2